MPAVTSGRSSCLWHDSAKPGVSHPGGEAWGEAREGGKLFAAGLVLARRKLMAFGEGTGVLEGREMSLRHLRQGWWEMQMFNLAPCPNASPKVQTLVQSPGGGSHPSTVQSGERTMSQTRTLVM